MLSDIVSTGFEFGVHGVKVDHHLERLWPHNIGLTLRLVDTVSIPLLLKTVQSARLA